MEDLITFQISASSPASRRCQKTLPGLYQQHQRLQPCSGGGSMAADSFSSPSGSCDLPSFLEFPRLWLRSEGGGDCLDCTESVGLTGLEEPCRFRMLARRSFRGSISYDK
ncbi:unnamed protein product [Moneuplotes crassus]|uniref:Uncharacterized protein n=1 Tax=Euplotes crassus TaxID=5936 RepID=A0AAD1YBS2_EUPCR|nr:unnamed protein product [Moneuplotes crassus]